MLSYVIPVEEKSPNSRNLNLSLNLNSGPATSNNTSTNTSTQISNTTNNINNNNHIAIDNHHRNTTANGDSRGIIISGINPHYSHPYSNDDQNHHEVEYELADENTKLLNYERIESVKTNQRTYVNGGAKYNNGTIVNGGSNNSATVNSVTNGKLTTYKKTENSSIGSNGHAIIMEEETETGLQPQVSTPSQTSQTSGGKIKTTKTGQLKR